MSDLLDPTPCLLFTSVLFNKSKIYPEKVKDIIQKYFGACDEFHPQYNPSLDYYSKEMGDKEDLIRIFFFNHTKYERDEFIMAKIWADKLEKDTAEYDKRIINIDVGLLTKEQMVLATGKAYSHRIYLSHGVYADLNYTYANDSYQKLTWTYPDYAHEEKLKFFNWLRQGLF